MESSVSFSKTFQPTAEIVLKHAKQVEKERKMKKEEADRKQAEHIRNSAMGNLGSSRIITCCWRHLLVAKLIYSPVTAEELLTQVFDKKH